MVGDAEVGLLVFLLLHGVGLLVNGDGTSAWLALWRALSAETLGLKVLGRGLLALSVLLLAPLLLGLSAFFAAGEMVCSSLALIFLSRSGAATRWPRGV